MNPLSSSRILSPGTPCPLAHSLRRGVRCFFIWLALCIALAGQGPKTKYRNPGLIAHEWGTFHFHRRRHRAGCRMVSSKTAPAIFRVSSNILAVPTFKIGLGWHAPHGNSSPLFLFHA